MQTNPKGFMIRVQSSSTRSVQTKEKSGKEAARPTIYPACEPKPPSPAPTEFNKAEEKLFLQSCPWMREEKNLVSRKQKTKSYLSQYRKQIANSNFLCRSTNYSFCLMCSPLELFHNGAGFF